jgi:hypothetical protein
MKAMRPINRKKIKVYGFIIIAAISILTLWSPTNNYVQVYKAIEKLDISASKSSFTFIPDTYRAWVQINATIGNPTGYRGIGIISLMFDLDFITNTTIVVLKNGYRMWFKDEPGEPLEPYSNITNSDQLSINLEKKIDIYEEIQMLQQNGQPIELFLHNAAIDTSLFLGRMIIPIGSIPLNDP